MPEVSKELGNRVSDGPSQRLKLIHKVGKDSIIEG